jgi:hypothetical protein
MNWLISRFSLIYNKNKILGTACTKYEARNASTKDLAATIHYIDHPLCNSPSLCHSSYYIHNILVSQTGLRSVTVPTTPIFLKSTYIVPTLFKRQLSPIDVIYIVASGCIALILVWLGVCASESREK